MVLREVGEQRHRRNACRPGVARPRRSTGFDRAGGEAPIGENDAATGCTVTGSGVVRPVNCKPRRRLAHPRACHHPQRLPSWRSACAVHQTVEVLPLVPVVATTCQRFARLTVELVGDLAGADRGPRAPPPVHRHQNRNRPRPRPRPGRPKRRRQRRLDTAAPHRARSPPGDEGVASCATAVGGEGRAHTAVRQPFAGGARIGQMLKVCRPVIRSSPAPRNVVRRSATSHRDRAARP